MRDDHNRRINYLRLSVTDLCNLRCRYCMPKQGIEKKNHQEILSFEQISTYVDTLVGMGIDKVRITGGEPLVRKDILTLLSAIGHHKEIKEFTLTTNGLLLKSMASALKEAGIQRVNISLDSLNPEKFRKMTRGGDLSDVIEGIEAAEKVGLTPIKINVVLIGGFNDDEIEDFIRLTVNRKIDVRFIELMPIGQVAHWSLDNFISADTVLQKVPELIKADDVEHGSPAVHYRLPYGQGRVGLIRPISCKFCKDCNRIRLTSSGQLKYCLHSNDVLDLRQIRQEPEALEKAIQDFIMKKPYEHQLEDGCYSLTNMVGIGG